MMRKPASVSLEGLARVLEAATCGSVDFRKKTVLDQTAAGHVIEAGGTAEVRTSGPHQRFKLSMGLLLAPPSWCLSATGLRTTRSRAPSRSTCSATAS